MDIEISNRQTAQPIEETRLRQAVEAVLRGEGFEQASISLAVVDDEEIHQLNRRWLAHDYPTDVLSFVLEQSERRIEGEIIVSADTAARQAERFGWSAGEELLLYAIHGALHLAGYDDLAPEKQRQMRERERRYLAQFNLKPQYEEA